MNRAGTIFFWPDRRVTGAGGGAVLARLWRWRAVQAIPELV
jgi:hypothetical protein